LVPEATNVDPNTLQKLAHAEKDDFYLSNASPFGIPFNNFRKSSSQEERLMRIEKGRPGSPCYKKELATNTEFTKEPICTASREYQYLKLKQLKEMNLTEEQLQIETDKITEKECLCEGLAASAILSNHIHPMHRMTSVAICPGPNLAYFSGQFTLKQMCDHIYGRTSLLNAVRRPHMFINELRLYIDYLKNEQKKISDQPVAKRTRYLNEFRNNLLEGIGYYRSLVNQQILQLNEREEAFIYELDGMQEEIMGTEVVVSTEI
jgi:hypothetical protein